MNSYHQLDSQNGKTSEVKNNFIRSSSRLAHVVARGDQDDVYMNNINSFNGMTESNEDMSNQQQDGNMRGGINMDLGLLNLKKRRQQGQTHSKYGLPRWGNYHNVKIK